jgi:hypothetical protein
MMARLALTGCSALGVALAGFGQALAGGDCPWRELESPPTVTVDEGVIWLTETADREWFICAKKAGGKLSVEYRLSRGGTLETQKVEEASSAQVRAGAYRNFLCEHQARLLRFRLVGTGPLERLSYTSEVIPVTGDMCPRCNERDTESVFAVKLAAQIEVTATVNEAFYQCAKSGAFWDLRFYAGESRDEILRATKPVYVHNLLTKAKHVKERILYSKICKGRKATWIGYEVVASGEMRRLSQSRELAPLKCR